MALHQKGSALTAELRDDVVNPRAGERAAHHRPDEASATRQADGPALFAHRHRSEPPAGFPRSTGGGRKRLCEPHHQGIINTVHHPRQHALEATLTVAETSRIIGVALAEGRRFYL